MNYFHKILIVLILSVTSFSQAEDSVVISKGDLEYSVYQSMALRILKTAYSRIGKSVEFKKSPAARSLVNADSGITDGELARIAGLEKIYPNLIRVPIPIAYDEVFVYSKKFNFKVEGWQSLLPYKIGYMSGFKRAEQKTAGMNTEAVTTEKQGLEKLNIGRTDVFIGLRGTLCLIKKLNLNEITAIDQRLEKIIMYHYLHKSHSTMAARLEAVLTQMQESGEMELIQQQAKLDYFNQCK